eukprot:42767_1
MAFKSTQVPRIRISNTWTWMLLVCCVTIVCLLRAMMHGHYKVKYSIHNSNSSKSSSSNERNKTYVPTQSSINHELHDQYCNTSHEYIYINGLENTGTNLLNFLIRNNCFHAKYLNESSFKKSTYFHRLLYVKNSSKHEMMASIGNFKLDSLQINPWNRYLKGLHVVIIKDPLTWFKSICKHSYGVRFMRNAFYKSNISCPTNISGFNGTASMNIWRHSVFESIVDLWNKYYESWIDGTETIGAGDKLMSIREKYMNEVLQEQRQIYDADNTFIVSHKYQQTNDKIKQKIIHEFGDEVFIPAQYVPRIVIKFEDILFNPKLVVQRICGCVGGSMNTSAFVGIPGKPAKTHGESRNKEQALATYSDPLYRYNQYTKTDLRFVYHHINHTLLKMFGYDIHNSIKLW